MGFVVIVTGAAGFIGRSLTGELLSLGELEVGDEGDVRRFDRLVLMDAVLWEREEDDGEGRVLCCGGVDVRSKEAFAKAVEDACGDGDLLSVFHLGGIASGDGERDDAGADLALDVNFLGTRNVMTFLRDRDRRLGTKSRMVFTSTNAVFAPTETIRDESAVMPKTSYGTAKAMCELLINDWSRRGFLDARCTRMPAVIPRTTPNASAASAWSEVIADPCSGRTAHLSVPLSTSLPIISIFHMMSNIIRLHNVPDKTLGENRIVTMPALAVTLDEAITAVEEVLHSRKLSIPSPIADTVDDPKVEEIVKTWPPFHHVTRAFQLGWTVDTSISEIVSNFLDKRHLLP